MQRVRHLFAYRRLRQNTDTVPIPKWKVETLCSGTILNLGIMSLCTHGLPWFPCTLSTIDIRLTSCILATTLFSLNSESTKFRDIQAVVLLLFFQHVSASCLGAFCLILSISYLPLHHSRCQNRALPLSSSKSRLCSHQTSIFSFLIIVSNIFFVCYFYDDDHINYVTVLRSKVHITE